MRSVGAAAVFVAFLWALPASAEPGPESAEELFMRARALMKSGDCANALPLLEQSHAIEPTLGTRFNMALCEGRTGKLTQAVDHLQSVVDASAPNDERRAHAERALRDIKLRMPFLVLELDRSRYELELVRLDGEPLAGLRVNEPFAINPGPHELEVVVAREAPQVRRFNISERQVYTWSLGGMSVAPAAGAPAAPATASPENDRAGTDSSGASEPRWMPQHTAAVVAGGTSLTAFGVAAGFALSARNIYDTSETNCSSNDLCDSEGIEERERAREHGNIATVALTLGVASAIAAGTLWFTAPALSSKRAPPLAVGVHFNPGGGGIVLTGSY
jgi:hypothetical protein